MRVALIQPIDFAAEIQPNHNARLKGESVRFRVRLLVLATTVSFSSASASADDIGAAARGVVRVIVATEDYSNSDNSSVSFGSGFAISPHRVVTNAHVIEDAENPFANSVVAVVPAEGNRALRGTIVFYDATRDLAVIDIGTARIEPLAIYSGPVESGEHTAALGYPGNVDLATAQSMYDLITPTAPVRSEGNVSSDRTINGLRALLHTAAISRGNSGGPLVDECGRVLGVNTYVTRSGAGDAAFGFAIVTQELAAFLREHEESFRIVGSACVTAAEQARREEQARQNVLQAQADAGARAAADQQRREEAAKANVEDARINHAVASALLALLALIGGGCATVLFLKDRARAGGVAATAAVAGLAAAGYAFFSRPGLNVDLPPLPAAAAAPLAGKLLCQVEADRSRITVSSTEDLAMNWDAAGCMNGRTQYVEMGATWRRVLVPDGTETVYVQDFDPVRHEYVSARYMLSQADMDRLRELRGDASAKSCSSDPNSVERLQQLTEHLVSSLPTAPNERLVYDCQAGQ